MSSNPHARSTDPSTSQEAGQVITREVMAGSHAHRALTAYRAAGRTGLTADEVDLETRVEGIWKRCSDLKALGYIEPVLDGSGEPRRRKSRYNFDNEVFAITLAGIDRLDALSLETPKRKRRARALTRERRIFNLVEEWMEPAPSRKGFGTALTRAEAYPGLFVKAVREEWEK